MVGLVSGYYSTTMVQTLKTTRTDLEDLQRQLGTGRKAETYGGLGTDRGLALDLRQNISKINTYQDSIQQAQTRISVMDDALKRIAATGTEVRQSARATEYNITSTDQSMAQISAKTLVKETLGLLDTEINGRHLFAGKATDNPPTKNYDQIMFGFNGEQGLVDVTNERIRADKGADGLGRLELTNTGPNVSLNDTATDFGYKLSGVSSGLSNATITGPAGVPKELDIDFTGIPTIGEKITVTLVLPDGNSKTLEMEATTAPTTPGDGKFSIGGTADDVALALKDELGMQIQKSVEREGEAASRIKASLDFFDTRNGGEPKRVIGDPPETATTLGTATAAGKPTINWYVGDNGTDSARGTASVKIDSSLEIDYGVRANEEGIARQLAYMAAYTIPEYSSDSSLNKDRYAAMTNAVSGGLSINQQEQTVQTIQSELSIANKMAKDTDDRHKVTKNMLQTMSDGIEGADKEEVAVKVMTLQNRMEMTYQATSILYNLSLVKYI
ncbi:MAG: hypothetical protein N4A65_15970 [Cohaesibacter sp.]|jgi:flagellin-like hook-associated protein FlgL|nr:hypothetical protein [Cohaesibacter sp.]